MNDLGDPRCQSFLAREVRKRIALAGHELAPDADLAACEQALRQSDSGPLGLVVLRSFDIETYLSTTLAFLSAQRRERLNAWARSFTRTVFLVGRPDQLAAAFPFDHVAVDRSMAWLLSDEAKQQTRLLRLLQRLKTSGSSRLPETLTLRLDREVGTTARQIRGWIAVAGLTLEDYLVHLNHLVCEAFISGALRLEDKLTLEHPSRINTLKLRPISLRIHRDHKIAEQLKLYGYLGVDDEQPAQETRGRTV